MQAHIMSLHPPLTSGAWSKCQNIFFSECGYDAYQIKGKEVQTDVGKTVTMHTSLTLGQVESNEIVQISIFFIKLSTKIVDWL